MPCGRPSFGPASASACTSSNPSKWDTSKSSLSSGTTGGGSVRPRNASQLIPRSSGWLLTSCASSPRQPSRQGTTGSSSPAMRSRASCDTSCGKRISARTMS
eukprot:scaffold324351_cov58-Tisochrysis_lutea.AAC.2